MRQCPDCGRFFKWGMRDMRLSERIELLKRNPGAKIICPPCGRKISRTIRTH